MSHAGHTPASYLAREYHHCINTYENARKRICVLAIEIYWSETSEQYREVEFKKMDGAAEITSQVSANVKKVDGYFSGSRTCHQPFSFSPFVAKAIDQLYDRGVTDSLRELIGGKVEYETDSLDSFNKNAKRLANGFGTLTKLLIDSPSSELVHLPSSYRDELLIELRKHNSALTEFIGQLTKTDAR